MENKRPKRDQERVKPPLSARSNIHKSIDMTPNPPSEGAECEARSGAGGARTFMK
jgi:hypothetical protein